MRESIGGTWIMQLVIVFMLLFVAFLALSLNYSKAFQMKNDMLTMIEKREGFNADTIELINNYLSANGYSVQKNCPENSIGITDLSRTTAYEEANSNRKYYYCVKKIGSGGRTTKAHYEVELFFYFNLPVVGDLFKFTINGTTNDIISPEDIPGM